MHLKISFSRRSQNGAFGAPFCERRLNGLRQTVGRRVCQSVARSYIRAARNSFSSSNGAA
jgi:hypothetical protein